jgi:hypothetical protein
VNVNVIEIVNVIEARPQKRLPDVPWPVDFPAFEAKYLVRAHIT